MGYIFFLMKSHYFGGYSAGSLWKTWLIKLSAFLHFVSSYYEQAGETRKFAFKSEWPNKWE